MIVIGGCVLEGGAISIIGVLLAAILLVVIENGILINRVDPFWVEFLMGLLTSSRSSSAASTASRSTRNGCVTLMRRPR